MLYYHVEDRLPEVVRTAEGMAVGVSEHEEVGRRRLAENDSKLGAEKCNILTCIVIH